MLDTSTKLRYTMNTYVRIASNWRLIYITKDIANFSTIYVGLRKSPHTLAVF